MLKASESTMNNLDIVSMGQCFKSVSRCFHGSLASLKLPCTFNRDSVEIVVGADLTLKLGAVVRAVRSDSDCAEGLRATPFVPKLHFPSAITVLTRSTPASHSGLMPAILK